MEQIIIKVNELLKTKKQVIISIDGCAASGKTTIAEKLSKLYSSDIIHMDHFFLPVELRTTERLNEPGGNIHYERFKEEVINNLGKPFSYNVYNCNKCCILRKKPYFDAAFGVSAIRKTGEQVSGDTHSVLRIDERKFLVALSDGMGSGEYARRISESTISLLESFYRAKMPSGTVLSTINKLLTFSKEETFACVDIAVVDLDDGRADIVKIGSPVGFILSGNTLRLLENSSLPLGILDSLHPETTACELMENDTLLFLSDGVTDAFGSTSDLYEVLKTLPSHNPQQLADSLLERALQAYGGIAKDDMTALAVRLFKSA